MTTENQLQISLQSATADVVYRFRKAQGSDYVRPALELTLPVPSASDLHALFSPEAADIPELAKTRATALDAITGVISAYVKGKVDADDEFDQEKLNELASEINLFSIANMPSSKRNVVTKDALEAFGRAYVEFCAANEDFGVPAKTATNVANVFIARLKPVAGNEAMMARMQDRLTAFAEAASDELNAEHEQVIQYLGDRINDALGAKIDLNDL